VAQGGDSLAITLYNDDDVLNLYNNIMLGVDGTDVAIYLDGNGNGEDGEWLILNNNLNQAALLLTGSAPPLPLDASNLDGVDPLFVNAGDYDLRLTEYSLCIDAGNPFVLNWTREDIDGSPRDADGNLDALKLPDIGAHEFIPANLQLQLTTPVVVGGTALSMTYDIVNWTGTERTVYFATRAMTPSGRFFPASGFLIPPTEIVLPPHGIASDSIDQPVGTGVRAGTFTYIGYVTATPGDELLDRDSVLFDVVEP
jgi:hypothetical protein